MAQRGREGAAKRAKERARQERQEAKRQRRREGPEGEGEVVEEAPVDEMALMEEFRLLSERHAAGLIDDAGYQAERHRLFVDLGIETEDEV
ncbi:MAG TPA: hypothetical protein VJ938_03250 [Acidimicrobiia bacterium]|jgi:hypothetical protein|nr:hypothetical protein [Acidimicrobiia bacterium]